MHGQNDYIARLIDDRLDVDEYGQVRQRPALAGVVAGLLDEMTSLVMSWCDGHDTRLTLTLSTPVRVGMVPGFAPDARILYVGVEGYGSYGFACTDEPLHPSYVAEKFARGGVVNPTWVALAELIGAVRQELAR